MCRDVKYSLEQVFQKLKKEYKHSLKNKPVELEFVTLEDDKNCMAITEHLNEKYIIKINLDELTNQYTFWLHILIHEFAHVLAGFKTKRIHTNQWGVWYAKIYRKVIDEDLLNL